MNKNDLCYDSATLDLETMIKICVNSIASEKQEVYRRQNELGHALEKLQVPEKQVDALLDAKNATLHLAIASQRLNEAVGEYYYLHQARNRTTIKVVK